MDFALAYIDPGSGSLIIQVLIASVLAVPYFLRTHIGRAIDSLRGRGKSTPVTDDEPESGSTADTPA
jgi:hypothetical protein